VTSDVSQTFKVKGPKVKVIASRNVSENLPNHNNLSVHYLVALKVDLIVRYRSLKTTEFWEFTSVKSKMADVPQILNL